MESAPLRADRIKGLLKVKHLKQTELKGVSQGELGKWLCGEREPSLADLRRLAVALDATSDYFIGLGDDFGNDYALAAAKMSFAYFSRDIRASTEQKQRCRRVFERDSLLTRDGAPLTAEAWLLLAEMIDRAVPVPPKIGAAKGA